MIPKDTDTIDVSGDHNQNVGNETTRSRKNISQISGGSVVGEIHGDYHSNGGKDRAIVEQEKNVQYSLDVLTMELHRYHEQLERKDVYIKEIIYNYDMRCAEKDKLIEDLARELAKISDKIIDMLNAKM